MNRYDQRDDWQRMDDAREYRRIFDSSESLQFLSLHRPYETEIRRTAQGDAFVIEGAWGNRYKIDDFVKRHSRA